MKPSLITPRISFSFSLTMADAEASMIAIKEKKGNVGNQ